MFPRFFQVVRLSDNLQKKGVLKTQEDVDKFWRDQDTLRKNSDGMRERERERERIEREREREREREYKCFSEKKLI